jgi:hypothetical protein
MRLLVFILLMFSFFGCNSDLDKIQGHWHSTSQNGRYETLDINDSIIILNNLDRHGFYLKEKIQFKDDKLLLPLAYHYGFNFLVSFNKDTLILQDCDTPISFELKFLKYNEDNNKRNHLSSDFNSQLDFFIEMDATNECFPFDSITQFNKWSMVNVGFPKESMSLKKDSLYINTEGQIINIHDLKKYLHYQMDEVEYENVIVNNQKNMIFIINADKTTPQKVIDSMIEEVNELDFIKEIYRTCIDIKNEIIGLYQVQ